MFRYKTYVSNKWTSRQMVYVKSQSTQSGVHFSILTYKWFFSYYLICSNFVVSNVSRYNPKVLENGAAAAADDNNNNNRNKKRQGL
jgi:hypothetical protein